MSHPVLIVDSEHGMRSALTNALSSGGYAVESVSDGSQALDRLRRNPFSLVITDMQLPEISGIEVLTEVKRTSPHVPVIMTTADGNIQSAVEADRKSVV